MSSEGNALSTAENLMVKASRDELVIRADGGEPQETGSDLFDRPNEGEVTLDPRFVCEECGFANVRLITANGKPAAKCTECGQGYLATEDDSL